MSSYSAKFSQYGSYIFCSLINFNPQRLFYYIHIANIVVCKVHYRWSFYKRNVRDIILSIRKRLKKFEKIFVRNPTVLARLENVGVIESKEAREIVIVGPFLRASNVMHDWRL